MAAKYSGEMRELNSETLGMLRGDDPGLTYLRISWDTGGGVDSESIDDSSRLDRPEESSFAHRVDWTEAGPCLGANTSIKKLEIIAQLTTSRRRLDNWEAFCGGISANRSIEHLRVHRIVGDEASGALIASLQLFVRRNANLRRLELSLSMTAAICWCPENVSVLASAMESGEDTSSLEELRIRSVARGGYQSVSMRPFHRSDETPPRKIMSAFKRQRTATSLLLDSCRSGMGESITLGGVLQNKSANITKLTLECDKIDDSCVSALAAPLANNATLKSLNISLSSVTPSGWERLFSELRDSHSALDALNLSRNNIDDGAVVVFGNWLEQTCNLRHLNLGCNKSITPEGWRAFLPSLRNQSALEELCLDDNSLRDDEVVILSNTLASNNFNLKRLFLHYNSLTISGWTTVSDLLQHKKMNSLEELAINCTQDEVLIAFANALAGNETLQRLNMKLNSQEVNLDVLSKVLCDQSSIAATFSSNHTLRRLGKLPAPLWRESVLSNLQLNENDDKSQVARQKVLRHHFSDRAMDANVNIFLKMDMATIPHAVAWMGRDNDGISLLHRFICSMPSIFKLNSGKGKVEGCRIDR